MQKFFGNRMLISILFSVVLTFAFVFAIVQAATTVSTDITTAGNIWATSTIQVTGTFTAYNNATISFASTTAISGTNINFTGLSVTNGTVTFASSTALSGTTICLGSDICRSTWPSGGTPTGFASSTINTGSVYFNGNAYVGIGSTTPRWLLDIATTTAPQLALDGGAGVNEWTFRNVNGILYFATSSNSTYATTTTSALSMDSTIGVLTVGFASTTAVSGTNVNFTNGSINFASTTVISNIGTLYAGGSATTTIDSAGNLTVAGTASTTSLRVGSGPDVSTVNDLSFGYCNTNGVSNVAASTTAYFVCTPQTAGNIQTASRVFVQATSSLPAYFVVIAASSTAVDTISVEVANIGWSGTQSITRISLNFIGIR